MSSRSRISVAVSLGKKRPGKMGETAEGWVNICLLNKLFLTLAKHWSTYLCRCGHALERWRVQGDVVFLAHHIRNIPANYKRLVVKQRGCRLRERLRWSDLTRPGFFCSWCWCFERMSRWRRCFRDEGEDFVNRMWCWNVGQLFGRRVWKWMFRECRRAGESKLCHIQKSSENVFWQRGWVSVSESIFVWGQNKVSNIRISQIWQRSKYRFVCVNTRSGSSVWRLYVSNSTRRTNRQKYYSEETQRQRRNNGAWGQEKKRHTVSALLCDGNHPFICLGTNRNQNKSVKKKKLLNQKIVLKNPESTATVF